MDENPIRDWSGPEGQALTNELLALLARGGSLASLGLDDHHGRVDLRGFSMPPPSRLATLNTLHGSMSYAADRPILEGAQLEGVDLSFSRLDWLQLRNCGVRDCIFTDASWVEFAPIDSSFDSCSFNRSTLTDSALGLWGTRPNRYRACSFTQSDLRRSACKAADFEDCDFSDARLEKIDFQSSRFTRCRFAGVLSDVIFWDRGFDPPDKEPNDMRNVDFSEATLHHVEFRRLDLDSLHFPVDPAHLVVTDYKETLAAALRSLGKDDSRDARKIAAVLAHQTKWAGERQQSGVFSLHDFGPDETTIELAQQVITAATQTDR